MDSVYKSLMDLVAQPCKGKHPQENLVAQPLQEFTNEPYYDEDLMARPHDNWFSQSSCESPDNYDTSYEEPSDDNSHVYKSACELPETADFKEWFLDFANNSANEPVDVDETTGDVQISIKSRSRRMLEAIDWISYNYKMETSMCYYNRYKRDAIFEPIPFSLFLTYV